MKDWKEIKKHWQPALTLTFCGLLISQLIFLNMPPSSMKQAITSPLGKVINWLGLYQGWAMFSNPGKESIAARVSYHYSDGSSENKIIVNGQAGLLPAVHQELYYRLAIGDPADKNKAYFLAHECRNAPSQEKLPSYVTLDVASLLIYDQIKYQATLPESANYRVIKTLSCSVPY